MFLARKITRPKWGDQPIVGPAQIPADAVTVDLRTQRNSLSFWKCGDGTTSELEGPVLALASVMERIDKIDLVWVPQEELVAADQKLRSTKGRTLVADMVDQHADVYDLDYGRLGEIASCVVKAIAEDRYRRFKIQDVRYLLVTAVRSGRVKLDELASGVQEQIRRVRQ